MTKLVFVYGSMKKDFCNHKWWMNDAVFVERVGMSGYKLYDTGRRYPVVVKDTSAFVFGEVYKVSEEIYTRLLQVEIIAGYNVEFVDGVYIFYFSSLNTLIQKFGGDIKEAGEEWLWKEGR